MKRPHWRMPARSVDLRPLLDTFLFCAVGTILIIRTQLWLTNYPQLGGHGLHIAHLLWGGLGMLIAIVILVAFLNPAARQVGAVLGGIGFGFFIDELGKFLTSDNNYFFKPTAAIIYIFFILFYLVVRQLSLRGVSRSEYLANAIELAKSGAIREMTAGERERALELLSHADPSDPLVEPTRMLIERARIVPATEEWFWVRWGKRLRTWYLAQTDKPWLRRVVTALFVLWALGTLLEVLGLVLTLSPSLVHEQSFRFDGPVTSKGGHYGFVEWANLVSSIVSGVFVVIGLVRLRRSRIEGYVWFERALLISIFFTQVFVFIQSQFGAVTGFLLDLLLFFTVRYMLAREREREGAVAETPPASAPVAARA